MALLALRLEAGNELLQVGDFVLLLAKRGLLLLQLLGAHVFKLAVVAAKTVQLAQLDVHGDAGHRVQKLAVMADDQHRAFVAFQPGFQPDQRVQVQMVGRLVQQQQVGRAHQRARQLQAHAPAAGEAVDRVVQLGGFEAQAQNQRLRAGRGVVRAAVGQRGVGVGHAVVVVGGLGGGAFFLRGQQGDVAVDHKLGGALLGFRHVLRDLRPCATAPGMKYSPPSSCSVPFKSANRVDLPAPLRPTMPTFSPGLMVTLALSSKTLALRRSTTFFKSNHEKI